jgi:exodeoxyribonuclease V beta subunit
MSTPAPFDVRGPLPTRRLAIEASAGTGKTYSIAGLVTRFVAETDHPVGELLVITFTRAATSELRHRIRQRLVGAASFLRGESDDPEHDAADDVLAALATDDPIERLVRIERLERAVAELDTATVSTIHGFCQRILRAGGLLGGDLDLTMATDDTVLTETVNDALATAALEPDPLTLEAKRVRAAVEALLRNPRARCLPGSDDVDADAEVRRVAALVNGVVETVRARHRSAGTVTFDDLLVRAHQLLTTDSDLRDAVVAELTARFPVAFVDEAQDTDPLQWEILAAIYPPDSGRLVLVGDPKQSIYAFRGADVQAYLDAAAWADVRSLTTNHRSDGPLLDALNQVFRGATFGDERIAYREVFATGAHGSSRLADGTVPVQLRCVGSTDGEPINLSDAERHIADDVVHVVQDTLTRGRLHAGDGVRPIRASEIAVLVATNIVGERLVTALRAAAVPAVFAGADSVAGSVAAGQWRTLLAALDRPSDPRMARTAAMGWLLGCDGDEVAGWSDERLAELQTELHDLAAVLTRHGMPGLWGALRAGWGVVERLRSRAGGERDLTDLEHLVELVHAELRGRGATAARAIEVLDALVARAEVLEEVAERRLESDADAVQILTIHRAKGLQFPVVLCPHLWRAHEPTPATKRNHVPIAHIGPESARTIDLAWVVKQDSGSVLAATADEELGEDLRKLYVAATRAQHRLVLWLGLGERCGGGALARVLGLEPNPATVAEVSAALAERCEAAAGGLEIVAADGTPVRGWRPPATAAGADLAESVAHLGRSLVEPVRRWSFTGIVAHAGDGQHDLEPSDAGADDETLGPEPAGDGAAVRPEAILAGLPGGADVGTVVHELLELVDPTAADLATEVEAVVERVGLPPLLTPHRARLVDGLARAIETPLGPVLDGRRLRDLAPGDRLAELRFDLPLPHDAPGAVVADIGRVLADHLRPDDPLAGYAHDLIALAARAPLVGVLTGSIDAVVRVRADPTRYAVVDYKTNRLAVPGSDDPLAPYHPDRLVRAMADHHYPLQALLYLVALHRYLRWRLRDPNPPDGVVAYLFLRGMVGEAGPTDAARPYGVFAWQPPPGLVRALSDLLAGRSR